MYKNKIKMERMQGSRNLAVNLHRLIAAKFLDSLIYRIPTGISALLMELFIVQVRTKLTKNNSRRSADGKLVSCHPLSYVVARF